MTTPVRTDSGLARSGFAAFWPVQATGNRSSVRRRAFFALALLAGCGTSALSPAPGTVNGCASKDFAPAAAGDSTVRIQYGDPIGLAYSPKCLTISSGQTVTFFGDTAQGANFIVHPLRPGGADGTNSGAGAPPNPIAAQNTGSTYTVAFPGAGTFGYFCQAHQSMGMYGAIQVK